MTVMDQLFAEQAVDIQTVILPVDFSPLSWRILPLAQSVAKQFGATIQPIHVDTASPWRSGDGRGLPEAAPLRLRATPYGHRVDVMVTAEADAADGILRFAHFVPKSLIAISAHGRTGVGEFAFGSVSEEVLRRTSSAVLAVGPTFDVERHADVRRIVACVDMTTGGDAIIPDALTWAQRLDVPLELLTVEPTRSTAYEQTKDDRAVFEHMVSALAMRDPRVSGVIARSPWPAREIVAHAAARRGTLLAMATHARPPVARTVVGSTVMAVVRHSPTGLLLRRRVT